MFLILNVCPALPESQYSSLEGTKTCKKGNDINTGSGEAHTHLKVAASLNYVFIKTYDKHIENVPGVNVE